MTTQQLGHKAPEPAPSQAAAVAPDPGLEAILQSRGIDTSLFPQLTAQGVQEQAARMFRPNDEGDLEARGKDQVLPHW